MQDATDGVIYASARDITDRRDVEAALVAGERQTRQIIEAAHDAFVAMDADGEVTDWNGQADSLFGWSREEAIGRELATLIIPEEHRAAHREGIERYMRTGEGPVLSRLIELTALHRDGREFPVELTISAAPASEDGCSFNAFVRDISARHATNELLDRQRRQLVDAQAVGGVGSWEWDIRADTIEWSDELCRMYGVQPGRPRSLEEFLGLVHPDDHARAQATVQAAYETLQPYSFEHRIVRPDGAIRVLHGRGEAITDDAGEVIRMLGTGQDITERKTADEARGLLAALVDSSEDAIIARDLEERIIGWNQGAVRLFGYTVDEAIGALAQMLVAPEDRDELSDILARVHRGERVETLETTRVAKDGRAIDVSVRFSAIYNTAGDVIGVSSIMRDITRQKQAEAQLRDAEERFRTAFDGAPIGVCLLSLDPADSGRLLQANPALAEILGTTAQDLAGVPLSSLTHPEDHPEITARLDDLIAGRARDIEIEKRLVHRNGHPVWTLLSAAPLPAAAGQPAVAVTHVMDISDRKRFEGQLQYHADHDALTGLFNRRRFNEELKRALMHAKRFGEDGAVLFLDLDGFKFVNDTLGHVAGDEMISRVASVLAADLREIDTLARVGGDEFAVLLARCDETAAVRVADKLLAALRHSGVTVRDDRSTRVTASIGITLFCGASGLTADELVVEADIAMYDAKAAGKDRHAVYERTEHRRELLSVRENWNERLRTAVERDGFVLHAQPIMPICTYGTKAFELLLRLPDDHGDLIPPGTFLYNAERFGLIEHIDRWVLRQAVGHLHASHSAGTDLMLTVNVSARTMGDPTLGAYVADLLTERPIRRQRLVIEITETAAITNIDSARTLAGELQTLGCQIALDDFGAGFASFYYLKHLRFDYLKIDGEFIRKICSTPTDRLVVQAVVSIARGLNTRTIAEFVGDDATIDLLRTLGVDHGQGYHFGRPASLETTLPYLIATPQPT